MPAVLSKPRGIFAKAIFCLYSIKYVKTVHAKANAISDAHKSLRLDIDYSVKMRGNLMV